jgi:hypothetical protein
MRTPVRATLVATAAAALLTVFAGPALAHHIDVSATVDCTDGKVYPQAHVNSQRGDYRFAGTATDSEGNSAAVTLPAGGGSTTVQLGPVTSSGSVHVVGDFWKANGDKAEHMDRTARYPFLADCKQEEETPPTTTPPTTAPPAQEEPPAEEETPPAAPEADEPKGSSTSRTREEPNPDDSIEVQEPRQPSQTMDALPFTGPREDLQRALLAAGLVLLLSGSLLVRGSRKEARVRR